MNSHANSKGKKFYFWSVALFLVIIFLINSRNGGNMLQGSSESWLNSSILGSKIFTVQKLFELLGGLGLFLFGIKFMGEGLQLSAGDKIKEYITKFTDNPLKGFMLGLIITGLIQSSSGTTALAVALVSVGLMSFRQSMAVIIGSNLGTTITSILIGLKIKNYVWMIIAIGGLRYMFANKKKAKYIAQTILGFGILFLGIKYMGAAMKPLAKEPWFKNLLLQMDKGTWYSTWLGLVVSIFLTVLVQSSSASIGIIQALHADKLLTTTAVIPMIFGANIGTTVTALLASLGASLYAKRTAGFHIVFNISGAILFTFLLPIFKPVVLWLIGGNLQSSALIPMIHVIFNTVMAILFIPLLPFMDKLICKIIKKESSEEMTVQLIELNHELLETSPTLAVEGVQHAIGSLVKMVNHQTDTVYKLFKHGDKKYSYIINDCSLAVGQYTQKVIKYIDEISSKETSEDLQKTITNLTLITRDIQRINSLNTTLKELAVELKQSSEKFSEQAYQEIKIMFKLATKIGTNLLQLLDEGFDNKIYDNLTRNEEQLNKFDKKFKKNHIARIKIGEASKADKKHFNEIITRIERIADHYKLAAEFLTSDHDIIEPVDTKLINELIAMDD